MFFSGALESKQPGFFGAKVTVPCLGTSRLLAGLPQGTFLEQSGWRGCSGRMKRNILPLLVSKKT